MMGVMSPDGSTTATIATRATTATASTPTERCTISMLRPGDDVSATFACTRKDRLSTRTGAPYLALQLRDHSGTIPARAFRDADALAGRFDRGDLVRAAGRGERVCAELVLAIAALARAAPPGQGGEPA